MEEVIYHLEKILEEYKSFESSMIKKGKKDIAQGWKERYTPFIKAIKILNEETNRE